jgi:hypothetical protein
MRTLLVGIAIMIAGATAVRAQISKKGKGRSRLDPGDPESGHFNYSMLNC